MGPRKCPRRPHWCGLAFPARRSDEAQAVDDYAGENAAPKYVPRAVSALNQYLRKRVWGRLVSLNPDFPNLDLSDAEVIIGRQKSVCTYAIEYQYISQQHCKVRMSGHAIPLTSPACSRGWRH